MYFLQFVVVEYGQPVRVASQALGQSYNCPRASEATLKDMGKINWYQTLAKRESCIYSMGILPLDKMATISQTTFSNAFSWMKSFVLIQNSLKFVPKGPIDNSAAVV